MEHTQSATELTPVVVEPNGTGGADVWLNRNITTKEIPLDDGLSQIVWEAEQLHYVAPNVPDPADIVANFDEIWDEFEDQAIAIDTRLERVQAQAEFTAIMTDTVL